MEFDRYEKVSHIRSLHLSPDKRLSMFKIVCLGYPLIKLITSLKEIWSVQNTSTELGAQD